MPLSLSGRERAIADAHVRLLPVDVTTNVSLATTQRFGPFDVGASVIIAITGDAHVNAGTVAVNAIATNPPLTAGVHDFVMPDGCNYVALLQVTSASGCAWKSP